MITPNNLQSVNSNFQPGLFTNCFWIPTLFLFATLAGCQADINSPAPTSSPDIAPPDVAALGPYKHVTTPWNNQFTCADEQWNAWQMPNERFPGIVARAVSRGGHYEIQFGNGYYHPVTVIWNCTSSTHETEPTQTTALIAGISTASPITTTISSTGDPTPDMFLNILDVRPAQP